MKRGLFILFLFVAIISCLSSVVAQIDIDANNPGDPLGISGVADNLPENTDEAKDVASDYLKQEWTKILERNDFGQAILGVGRVLSALNPVFLILFGLEYSFSWYFFMIFFLWITIFVIIFRAIYVVFPDKMWISLGISLIVLILGAQTKSIQKGVDLLSPFIQSRTAIFLFFLGLIILLTIDAVIMRMLRKITKDRLDKDKEALRELKAKTVEKIHDITIRGSGGRP